MASSRDMYTGRVGARMGRGAPLLMGATALPGFLLMPTGWHSPCASWSLEPCLAVRFEVRPGPFVLVAI